MHMHPAAIGLQPISSYAAGNEGAAAAQRAAEIRKRLLKFASSIDEAAADPEATQLIGQWLDSRHSQVLSGDEYHTATEGKDPDFG